MHERACDQARFRFRPFVAVFDLSQYPTATKAATIRRTQSNRSMM